MLKISFGRRPRPKEFGFKPRYYDPDKEDLEKRLEKYKKADNNNDDANVEHLKERIRFGMHNKLYGNADIKKKEVRNSNLRLLYIIIVLIIITYAILQSDKIANLIEVFQKK